MAPTEIVYDALVDLDRLSEWATIVSCVHDAPEIPFAGAAFHAELPSLQSWSFARDAADGIPAPLLSVYHDDPRWGGFRDGHEVLCSWFPQAEGYVAPVSSHLLHIMNPSAVADGLSAFLARHTANDGQAHEPRSAAPAG